MRATVALAVIGLDVWPGELEQLRVVILLGLEIELSHAQVLIALRGKFRDNRIARLKRFAQEDRPIEFQHLRRPGRIDADRDSGSPWAIVDDDVLHELNSDRHFERSQWHICVIVSRLLDRQHEITRAAAAIGLRAKHFGHGGVYDRFRRTRLNHHARQPGQKRVGAETSENVLLNQWPKV